MKRLEQKQRIKEILRFLTVQQVLDHYSTEITGRRKSRKGGQELDGICPFHDSATMNFSIHSERGGWFCRSALCGKRGDLVRFVALQENCSDARAYLQLCFLANIDPASIDDLSIALSFFNIGEQKVEEHAAATPMRWPRQYKVMAHPYLVEERLIDPDVLIAAKCGGIYHDEFFKYRAVVPIMRKNELYSLYSRRVSDDVLAWQRANPKLARKHGSMFRKHDYTGSSLTSHFIYGIDEVEGSVLILVEAIISVLRLRSLGIHNAAAMMKADLSSEQVRQIVERGFTTVYICGDNDLKVNVDTGKMFNPGMKANWRTYRRLKKYVKAGIVELPHNRDPADTDDPFTAEEFHSFLAKARFPQGQQMKAIEGWFQL